VLKVEKSETMSWLSWSDEQINRPSCKSRFASSMCFLKRYRCCIQFGARRAGERSS